MSNLVPTQIQDLRFEAERLRQKLARVEAEIEAQVICAGEETADAPSVPPAVWDEWPYSAARSFWAWVVEQTRRQWGRQGQPENPTSPTNSSAAAALPQTVSPPCTSSLLHSPAAANALKGLSLDGAVRMGAPRLSGLHSTVIAPASSRTGNPGARVSAVSASNTNELDQPCRRLRLV